MAFFTFPYLFFPTPLIRHIPRNDEDSGRPPIVRHERSADVHNEVSAAVRPHEFPFKGEDGGVAAAALPKELIAFRTKFRGGYVPDVQSDDVQGRGEIACAEVDVPYDAVHIHE